MILKSIEIQGFKSFADKTVLKFGKGITAVVGPNGSGKSNISDAVRWVLGEQSTKNLRGQSMEDVIFSGTASRRPHGYAEVTLTIDNTDRALNCDSDTVNVTRRIYRSKESEYLINKTAVRLRDINELFMDTGLGRDGYSMIGQGKIDSIVSTKSNERRDIFEEAAGISRYRYRKTEAEKKLAAADDNMLRLKDILTELEDRVGPLAEQSKKAQKFLDYSKDKKRLEIGLWLRALEQSNDNLKAQEQKISLVKADYDETERASAQIAEQLEELSREYTGSVARIDELRRESASLEEKISDKRGEAAVIENSVAHNNETIKKLRSDIEELAESDGDVRAKIEERKERIEAKNRQIAELNGEAAEIESELNGLIGRGEAASKRIEELSAQLNETAKRISDLRVESVTARSSAAEILSRKQAAEAARAEAEKNSEKAEGERRETESYLNELEETENSCRNSLAGYELRLKARTDKKDKASEALSAATAAVEEKRRRVKILSDLEKNMDGFDNSVKQVVSRAKAGLLSGVVGTVSSVISVKNEYAVAIETALGNALRNVIVETEQNAKSAIEYLKREKAGRVTFLPVATIKGRELDGADGVENCPGFVGVASALVDTDGKYREIVSSLLGRTVITEDLDSAAAIAGKYRYKFKTVSLDGQVVNPGGSMTGGSHIKGAGILSRAGNIARLNEEIAEEEKKIEELTAAFEAAAAEVASSEAEILSARSALTTANEDKIRALGELRRVGDLADAAKADIKRYDDEISELDRRAEALTATALKKESEINDTEAVEARLRAEAEKETGGRDSLSAERSATAERLTSKRLMIAEAVKDAESYTETMHMLEYSVRTSGEKSARMKEQIEELTAENGSHAAKISELESESEELRSRINGISSEIEALIGKRDCFDRDSRELRTGEREKSEKKERLGGEIARLEERRETMMREFDDIVRRLYDEYELTRSEAEAMGIVIEDAAAAKRELSEIRSKIKSLGSVNVSAIEEYKEVSERYTFLKGQLDDVEKSRKELGRLIEELTADMKIKFTDGFNRIGRAFSATFRELFGGGSAELRLTDPENVLESGIDISAKLPGKNVPSLDGLSGGEKALIAISIYFAIMSVNAPPFCFLDEIDTALDDINVDRLAAYMKNRGLNTQFICITHRRGTMEAADMLYGVTMQEKGVTKLLELDVDELVKTLNIEDR